MDHLSRFCRRTGLHGWSYLLEKDSSHPGEKPLPRHRRTTFFLGYLIRFFGGHLLFHGKGTFWCIFTHLLMLSASSLIPGFRLLFWSVSLFLALACSAFLVSSTSIDFLRATIVTSLDSQNVPLSEVFFPSVVVCNLNQVSSQPWKLRKCDLNAKVGQSFFVEFGIDGNRTLSQEVYDQLVHGKSSSTEVNCYSSLSAL